MKLITAIIQPHKLDDVKEALAAAGVHGLTVSVQTVMAVSAATPRSTVAPNTPWISFRRSASRCCPTTPMPKPWLA